MKRQQVNIHFVTALLEPLVGGADDDAEVARYRHFAWGDDEAVDGLLRRRLMPYFARFDPESKAMAKRSLGYFLCKAGVDFVRVYDSCLLPMPVPPDAREFFLRIWREVLDGGDLGTVDVQACEENNDIHAANGIRLSPTVHDE